MKQKSSTADRASLNGVLSVLVILENIFETTDLTYKLLNNKTSQGITTEVFEAMYIELQGEGEENDIYKTITRAASTVWSMISTSASTSEDDSYRSLLFEPVLSHVKDSITDVTRAARYITIINNIYC